MVSLKSRLDALEKTGRKDGRCHCPDESVKIVHGEEPVSERCPLCGRERYVIRIVRTPARGEEGDAHTTTIGGIDYEDI